MTYEAIELFFEKNREELYGRLKPSKSVVKDVENCFNNFKRYFLAGHTVVTKSDVPQIINREVDENTRNQNIRVMQEFGYLASYDGDGGYTFTNNFVQLCKSSQPLGIVVLDALYNIYGVSNLTMYLNYLLCTLREAYLYGEVILFPDSAEKFQTKVPDKSIRDKYRQRVFDLYGFIGDTRRPVPHSTTDEYTPNMSYMSRTELENLGLLVKANKRDGLDTLTLTTNGHHLLKKIDENLSQTPMIRKYMNIVASGYQGDIAPIIFYGAPGTGKTRHIQENIYSKYNADNRLFTTFHQSYSYEDFVEGLKPILGHSGSDVQYHIETGVFYKACERAAILAGYDSLEDCIRDTQENRIVKFNEAIEGNKTMLLCIDEINRGNVASIFGDLISLIEPSKRLGAGKLEMTAILPYSKKSFGVPANLFIVGTMNTADRSIQLLDSALRRRFKFIELTPDYKVFTSETSEAEKVLRKINARVRSLLNKDNQIGHSYLMFAKSYCDILSALYNKIIPLLEEYFYNDIDKVRFVLNDNTDAHFYVEDTEAKEAYKLFQNEEIDDEDRDFYELNPAIAIAIESGNDEECKKYLANLL